MLRHLLPRATWGHWTGDALTVDPHGGRELPPGLTRNLRLAMGKPTTTPVNDGVHGRILCVQWLGMIVEIAFGRVI